MRAFLQYDREGARSFLSALRCGLLIAALALASPPSRLAAVGAAEVAAEVEAAAVAGAADGRRRQAAGAERRKRERRLTG